jgi:xylulokinase
MLFDVAGTASVLAGCTDTFVADVKNRALLTMRSVIPGLWHPLAYIAGGGQAWRWYRDQFYNTQRGQALPLDGGDLYSAMAGLAGQAPPGSEGLFFSPHLGGRICPATPEMRGAWIGFSWGHGQAHFFRAILESVAYEYAYYLGILRDAIPEKELTETRAVGGGARSNLWNQIKADILGVPYQRLGRSEFGTWGAAMVAGKAVGIFPDLAEVAGEHAKTAGKPLRPQAENEAIYRPLIKQYIRLQESLRDAFVEMDKFKEND